MGSQESKRVGGGGVPILARAHVVKGKEASRNRFWEEVGRNSGREQSDGKKRDLGGV